MFYFLLVRRTLRKSSVVILWFERETLTQFCQFEITSFPVVFNNSLLSRFTHRGAAFPLSI